MYQKCWMLERDVYMLEYELLRSPSNGLVNDNSIHINMAANCYTELS